MYTVMISDDGMFSAEFVQPPALSIPLGTSGSAVEVRRNEDLTFSAMIDGEWMMITADTTVMAANGNVYAAVLSPEGIPIGVMHVPAMQEVMLGELGGTVTVMQAEDMTWWIGEMLVENGTEYTAANGNVYVLMMVDHGDHFDWVASYQSVMVMVDLGTQGSITLTRAEDMSWWLGSEAVDVGSEVMSDNGNTYTLWYTDGVWSARFEPESMMIEGTGLIAMTREADDMYDVGDTTLPATGMGDITVDGAMYHVWMADGMLMGARFDAAIDTDTDYKIGTIGLPTLSANDPDKAGTELRSYLVVTGDDDTGMGMFSIGDLLGSGMASDEGMNFVYEAVKAIKKVETDVAALLALDTKPATLDAILESQWTKLEMALDTIFGTDSDHDTPASRTSAVRQTAPREEDILDDIADILDALSSEDAFVAATAEDGGGVFESQALGAGGARNAFNRLMWTADATMGMTGSTRYGTAARKTSANAKKDSATSEYGAFSYSTMQQTVRTADIVSPTGIASYAGGTHAVNTKGKVYTGMMELQVRFKAESVSGVVSGLQDSDGLAWQHNFADVDRIVLDDGTLRRNAKWTHTGTAGSNATVFYAANSGLLRPVTGITNTFDGILLGQGADAGSEANGTWSIGTSGGSGYLAGAFGVEHVADTARPVPSEDDGSAATAMLFTMAADANAGINMTSQSIGDGMLTVKQRAYGYRDDPTGGGGGVTYGYLSETYADGTTAGQTTQDGTEDPDPTLITAKFSLAELKELGGGVHKVVNGATWVSQVISTLTTERDLLSTLQSLDSSDTQSAEVASWGRVQFALQYQMLGNLPIKMDDAYGDLESEADAIDLINRALDALSSNTKLAAALDPDSTGIFDHYDNNADGDDAVTAPEDITNFVNAAKEKVNNRTFAQMRGEKMQQVFATLGSTSYTRFGVWRRQSTQNSIRTGGVIKTHGGPGTFAYSALDPTNAGTPTNTGFPQGGSATYTGETVALQNTTWLTGTVRVDVAWSADADSGTAGTFDASVGTMSLTISDLASPAGDPLTYGGAPKANAAQLAVDPTAVGGAGTEIADIVIGGLNIVVGAQGDNMGQLIVGTAGTPDANGNVAYTEIAPTSARLRFAALGTVDNTTSPPTTGSGVKAMFVGQGVDGPLGAIGTYTIATGDAVTPGNVTGTTSTSIGRLGADGTQTVDVGVTIYGAFGAQVP